MSIVQTLLEQVQAEVEHSGHRGRVVAVHLVIGRLSGVHVESLRFAFDVLARDSLARGAELVMEQPRATLHCRKCQANVEIEELMADCPACGGQDVTIHGGQQLLLQSIELEDQPVP